MSFPCTHFTKLRQLAKACAVMIVLLTTSSVGYALMVPDFALEDVNSTSFTYEQQVSPRDYLHQASGWYFGHAAG